MILEHELPHGTKLYFDKSAKLKRELESKALEVFLKHDYREIVTPIFSYLEHQKDVSNRELIRITAPQNHQICLRYDTTLDIIRIITKTIGRSTEHKKWFYAQPVFSYPSSEYYQIGAEHLEEDSLEDILGLVVEILDKFKISPILQIANMNIPKLCEKHSGIDIKTFARLDVDALLKIATKESYVGDLLRIKHQDELKEFIHKAPSFLKEELEELLDLGKSNKYQNKIYSPLFYAPSEYYEDLFFRAFYGNSTLLLGGRYQVDSVVSCGFAAYMDDVINYILEKGK